MNCKEVPLVNTFPSTAVMLGEQNLSHELHTKITFIIDIGFVDSGILSLSPLQFEIVLYL